MAGSAAGCGCRPQRDPTPLLRRLPGGVRCAGGDAPVPAPPAKRLQAEGGEGSAGPVTPREVPPEDPAGLQDGADQAAPWLLNAGGTIKGGGRPPRALWTAAATTWGSRITHSCGSHNQSQVRQRRQEHGRRLARACTEERKVRTRKHTSCRRMPCADRVWHEVCARQHLLAVCSQPVHRVSRQHGAYQWLTHQVVRHQPPPRVTSLPPAVRSQLLQLVPVGPSRLFVLRRDAPHPQLAARCGQHQHHAW